MSKNKLKIAIYLPSLRGGGAERVMVTLANGFVERGHSVDLVLVKAEGPYLTDVSGGVRVVDLNALRVITSLGGLVRYLRNVRPEAMLSAMSHANVVAVASRMLARVPTRVVVSERTNFTFSVKNAPSMRGRNMGRFIRWAYRRADGIISVSNGAADDLASWIGVSRDAINVVYNPVVTNYLHTLSQQEPENPRLSPSNKPVVLGVGRLSAAKDFSTLIKAFALLRARRKAHLLILGEGELRQDLEILVQKLGLEDDVSLPGFVDNPFAIMRKSELFVLSSAWEGLPNVLIQAMACGTPVVSTDCPSGPAEILENGKWGRLVPVGDVDALAEAMAAALDESEHTGVARRGADFNVNQAVEGYLKILSSEE